MRSRSFIAVYNAVCVVAGVSQTQYAPTLSPVNKYARFIEASRNVDFYQGLFPYLPLKNTSTLPASSRLEAKLQPGAVRKRIRYGPYHIPASNETTLLSILGGEKGAINAINKVDAVCLDCLVLYGKVTLENADGSLASLSEGTYFHHAAMVNLNKKRQMYTCSGKNISEFFPAGPAQFIIGVSDDGENWFTDKATGKYKSGYYITPKDEFTLMVEVMNYTPVKKTVYMNYEVEYMPGKPTGWSNTVNPILNVAPCGHAKVDFKVPTNKYTINSKPWKSTIKGTIINVLGHLHDGGDSVSIRLNGKEICLSKASYGTAREYIRENPIAGKSWESLSHMDECSPNLPLRVGDIMTIQASYDLDKHPMRMSSEGHIEEVMGLGFVYAAVPL